MTLAVAVVAAVAPAAAEHCSLKRPAAARKVAAAAAAKCRPALSEVAVD